MSKISACVVVYNEEKVVERCLKSIVSLVDEVVVVHDGECKDRTLEIAKKFTDKIFVRPHVGEAEPHRVFCLHQTTGDWILQIDGDEYLDEADHEKIKQLITSGSPNGYIFQWEGWTGSKAVHFKGLQKMCLFRKASFHYIGVPHEIGRVDGEPAVIDLFLHHRPLYNNMSWSAFLRKMKRWVPVHARYFFPDRVTVECFNEDPAVWLDRVNKVKSRIYLHMLWEPLKMFLGQMKNGLWTSWIGFNLALQQYVYYLALYCSIWRIERKQRLP